MNSSIFKYTMMLFILSISACLGKTATDNIPDRNGSTESDDPNYAPPVISVSGYTGKYIRPGGGSAPLEPIYGDVNATISSNGVIKYTHYDGPIECNMVFSPVYQTGQDIVYRVVGHPEINVKYVRYQFKPANGNFKDRFVRPSDLSYFDTFSEAKNYMLSTNPSKLKIVLEKN